MRGLEAVKGSPEAPQSLSQSLTKYDRDNLQPERIKAQGSEQMLERFAACEEVRQTEEQACAQSDEGDAFEHIHGADDGATSCRGEGEEEQWSDRESAEGAEAHLQSRRNGRSVTVLHCFCKST